MAKMGKKPGAPAATGLLSKIRAFSEGWVVGSVPWVESFCEANGWSGLSEGKMAQPIAQDASGELHDGPATVVKRL